MNKYCLECGKDISEKARERKFCSTTCSNRYYNAKRIITRLCKLCGKPVKYYNTKYCSYNCANGMKIILRNTRIRKQGFANNEREARQFLISTAKHECSICNTREWQGKPVPLVMDHIDGHAENNSLDNIRFVCPNCDAQLPTYKSKNRGNGRAFRRARYAQGKSY